MESAPEEQVVLGVSSSAVIDPPAIGETPCALSIPQPEPQASARTTGDTSTLSIEEEEASGATDDAVAPSSAGPGKKARRKSQLLWQVAGAKVTASLLLTEGFMTLRDRTDLVVHADDLEVKQVIGAPSLDGGCRCCLVHLLHITGSGQDGQLNSVGEGAFGTVQQALWRPPQPALSASQLARRSQEQLSQTSQPQLLQQGSQGKVVAVKRVKKELLLDEAEADEMLEMFANECSLNKKLKHKFIVEYIGLGCDDVTSSKAAKESLFLVQEFMGGGTLKQLVTKQMGMAQRLYSMADGLRWATQIASALAYLHSCIPIVIHRDLKLENILLSQDKQVAKLADFGLAAVTHRTAASRPSRAGGAAGAKDGTQDTLYNQRLRAMSHTMARTSTLARTFTLKKKEGGPAAGMHNAQPLVVKDAMSGRTGTLMYMAPEMFRGDKYDEKVDVFSFGIIMYELFSRYLTIYAVSNAGTEEEIEAYVARVAAGYRPPLTESWSAGLQRVISDCWTQDPARRPSMSQVHERLVELAKAGIAEDTPEGCSCVIA